MNKFTVIMAVYCRDNPKHFIDAVLSVVDQTCAPEEVVIAVDGPLGSHFDHAMELVSRIPNVRLLQLSKNVGPGLARHHAILTVKTNLFAIMDSDDLSLKDRFEKQLKCFSEGGVDCVGSFIEEFDNVPGDLKRLRTVPCHHEKIVARGRWRYPLNHVTLMMRVTSYHRVGGYKQLRFLEDYDFFYRSVSKELIFSNIPEVLVCVRSGGGLINRRTGLDYLNVELALIKRMLADGYLSYFQWLVSATLRVFIRLLPVFFLNLIYVVLRKRQR